MPLRPRLIPEIARLRSADALLLAGSPLLDQAWYLEQNPEVASQGLHPLTHYLLHGAWEGRDPSPVFDSDFYLKRHPELRSSRENPVAHYLRHGVAHNFFPSRRFDPGSYLAAYPDVRQAGIEPLTHYLLRGMAEGRLPNPGARAQQPPEVGSVKMIVPAAAPAPARATSRKELPQGVANRDGPRLLIVDGDLPRPDRDSGSVTMSHLIRMFLRLGWQVSFFVDGQVEDRGGYARRLEQLGVRVLRAPGLESFLQDEGSTFSLAMLFRVRNGGRHYELVRRLCPDARIVFETVDLHFLREEREARLHRDQRALNVARATRERELYVARSCDLTIVVSEFERELLEREAPGVRVMTLPLILDCPGRTAPFEARSGVAFLGGFRHRPNLDAVNYFLDAIWPRVLERLPSCVFHIVGPDLPGELAQRAGKSVIAVGQVEDLEAFLGKIRVTVAPLRYGAGAKGKVGSSLAAGVPCVCTSVAAEGMGLEVNRAIPVADEPQAFADRIVALHEDPLLWERMSDAGWEHAAAVFSPDAALGRIRKMLEELALLAPGPDARRQAEAI